MNENEHKLTDEDLKKLFLLLKENYSEDPFLTECGEEAFYRFFGNEFLYNWGKKKTREQLYSGIESLLSEYNPVVDSILREALRPIIMSHPERTFDNIIPPGADNDQPTLSGPDYGSYYR